MLVMEIVLLDKVEKVTVVEIMLSLINLYQFV